MLLRVVLWEATRWNQGNLNLLKLISLAHQSLGICRCHLGKVIVYDTITKFGWSSNIQNHGIKTVIDKVLSADWEPEKPVPEAVVQEDCVVRRIT